MIRAVVTVLVMLALFVASWFVMPVERIEVSGNTHLPERLVARLANASLGSPWLWVQPWRMDALAKHPWVARVEVIKHFPSGVEFRVTERVPAALLELEDGRTQALASDGTPLPNAKAVGVRISGWGPNRAARVLDALKILQVLQNTAVNRIKYSPQGFTILKGSGDEKQIVFTDSLASLLQHGESVKILSSARVSIHPWGVSIQ